GGGARERGAAGEADRAEGVLLDQRGLRAGRAEAARAAVLGDPVPGAEPVEEPVRQPRLPAQGDPADLTGEAPAVRGEVYGRGCEGEAGSAAADRRVDRHRGSRARPCHDRTAAG